MSRSRIHSALAGMLGSVLSLLAPCVVQAGIGNVGLLAATTPQFENDTNRWGSDYADFDVPGNNPQVCSDRCAQDENCAAWTYVKPGQRGAIAHCYLKNPAPSVPFGSRRVIVVGARGEVALAAE